MLAAFGLIIFSPLEVSAMILHAMVQSVLFVSFPDCINRLIPSKHRATLLSFDAMCFSIMMIPFFPVIGAVADHVGFKTAFAAIFAASIPVPLLIRWLLLKRVREEQARIPA
jgi:predicted MFS family arabinose efflux permease